jgi:hypothetical protein
MRNLFMMKILVARFLVLLPWSRKYFKDIARDPPPAEGD